MPSHLRLKLCSFLSSGILLLAVWCCWPKTLSLFYHFTHSISKMMKWKSESSCSFALLWPPASMPHSLSCFVELCYETVLQNFGWFLYSQRVDRLTALMLHEKQVRLMRAPAEREFGWRCVARALALWEISVIEWDLLWTQSLAQCLTMDL